MNTEQTISALQELLEQKIISMKNQFAETVKLIKSLDNSAAVSIPLKDTEQIKKQSKQAKVKPVKSKHSDDGKVKFSKYLLSLFEDHPEKDYDLAELGDQLKMAIESGEVYSAAGIIKDEVSKRLYQFIKRRDIFRTIAGTYQFNPGRGNNPEINKH